MKFLALFLCLVSSIAQGQILPGRPARVAYRNGYAVSSVVATTTTTSCPGGVCAVPAPIHLGPSPVTVVVPVPRLQRAGLSTGRLGVSSAVTQDLAMLDTDAAATGAVQAQMTIDAAAVAALQAQLTGAQGTVTNDQSALTAAQAVEAAQLAQTIADLQAEYGVTQQKNKLRALRAQRDSALQ